jgi:hypothetical protein
MRTFRPRRGLVAATAILATAAFLPSAPAGAVNIGHTSIVNEDAAGFTPNIIDGRVNVMIVMNGTVYVGGTFSTVQNAGSATNITRNYVLAYNATTGVVSTTFRPIVTGAVEALAPGPDGTSIYIGGNFGSTNGSTTYRRLVRVNATTGATVTSFITNPNRMVLDLVLRSGQLYAAGEFTQIGGSARSGLARLNPTTGAADPTLNLPFTDPWISPRVGIVSRMRVWRIDVTPDGSKLVAGGNFRQVGGIPRDQVAILDVNRNPVALDSWSSTFFRFTDPNNPDPLTNNWCSQTFPHYLRDIDISPDGSYAAIVNTGANRPGHISCDSLTRWNLSASGPNQEPDWVAKSGGDSFHSVLATGAAIYAGGHQQWMNNPYNPNSCGNCTGPFPGGTIRTGFSAHDPSNGLPFSWNPVRNPRGKGVLAMVSTPTGFFFGSDTNNIHAETHRRNGFLPLLGGVTVPANAEYGLPGGFFTLGQSGTPGDLLKRTSTGTTFTTASEVAAPVDWTNARGGFVLNGTLYTGMADGTLVRRSFDGTTAGATTVVNLFGLDIVLDPMFVIPGTNLHMPTFSSQLADSTGMFFEDGFIYYSVQGDPRLYARGFTQEDQLIGAALVVPSTGDGVDWANVRGMTMASGNLYFALLDGTLNKVAWNGDPFGHGHPTGSVTKITGTNVDGINWASNGMFVFGS